MTKSTQFFLFGIAAMVSLVFAKRPLLDNAAGASSALLAQEWDGDAANSTDEIKLAGQHEQQNRFNITSTAVPLKNEDLGHFKIGGIVELYTDESYFATPAIVMGYTEEKSSTQYSLLNTITNNRLPRVESEFIHPYRVYEDETRASCNVGALRKPSMTPCVIVSHSTRKSGVAIYQVSYLNKEQNTLVDDNLPFSRVQRIHGRIPGRRNGLRVK